MLQPVSKRVGCGMPREKPTIQVLALTVAPATDDFMGVPDRAKLYPVRRRFEPTFPEIPVGKCVVCGIICQWPAARITGPVDRPTVMDAIGDKVATLTCNCPNCGHRWQVVEGRVVDKTEG